ncbi:hypothetical protein GEMRC1_001849 [Eukaryota sp. GEM-RC1]
MHDSLRCPITSELMSDAVVTPYGHSFSQKAILEWLRTNNVCPITRKPLSPSQLIPNYALREFISSLERQSKPDTSSNSSRCLFERFSQDNKSYAASQLRLEELTTRQLELESRLTAAARERTFISEQLLSDLPFQRNKF